MGTFHVAGADRETGEPRTLRVEAADPKDAERIANAVGVVVAHVAADAVAAGPSAAEVDSEGGLWVVAFAIPIVGYGVAMIRLANGRSGAGATLFFSIIGTLFWAAALKLR